MSTATLRSDAIQVGSVHAPPIFVNINTNTSGNTTVVAAVTGKKIRVLNLTLMSAGAVTAKFTSSNSGTDLAGTFVLAASTVVPFGFSPIGHFETNTGELLNLNLNTGVRVSGTLAYIQV